MKAEVGLEVACADAGGWDTHEEQGGADGWLSGLVEDFGASLTAFYTDMQDHLNNLTVVTMSEFGRRVAENASRGTDHGHGNVMFVMSGASWAGCTPTGRDYRTTKGRTRRRRPRHQHGLPRRARRGFKQTARQQRAESGFSGLQLYPDTGRDSHTESVRMRRILVTLCLALIGTAWTQKGAAIAAAAHPALKPLLALYEGWSADAYDTENDYGVWRVQFYLPGGEKLGWADVNPEKGEVYAWEASYELTGPLQRRAQRVLYRFVQGSPEVRALVGNPVTLEKWFWYDSWREGWFVHLERGGDSLDVSLRSHTKGPLKLTDLFVGKIYFPNTLGLDEYRAARRGGAVTLAFAEPEIAALLRDRPGWTSSGTLLGGELWQVSFTQNGGEVARAVVDLDAHHIRRVTLTP